MKLKQQKILLDKCINWQKKRKKRHKKLKKFVK